MVYRHHVTADDHGWCLLDVGRCSDPLPFFSSRTSNAGDGISIGMLQEDWTAGRAGE
jgi:hypothetical protein